MREKFRGFFFSGASPTKKKHFWIGERSWEARCKYWDKVMEKHPLAKQGLLATAGQVMAQGIFIEAAGDYPRAEEAAERIRQLNDELGIEVMLFDTTASIAKFGSCFWEKTWTPKFDLRILPAQEYLEPAQLDEEGNVIRWQQNLRFGTQSQLPTWSSDEVVHFPWNVTSNSWPYGTSMLVGLDKEFEVLEKLEDAITDFAVKQGLPKELWQVGDRDYTPTDAELDTIRSKIKTWSAGEEFVTNYTINRIAGGTGEHPLSEFAKILDFCYTHVVDGLMIAPISKQWSSTMASAQEMQETQRANIIVPLQRLISLKLESEVYRPYLIDLGYSVKVCPKVKWEPPDAHKDEDAEYYSMLVQTGIIPAELAAEEMGFDMDKVKKYREEELKRQEEQMKVQGQQQFPISPKQGIKQKVNPEDEE